MCFKNLPVEFDAEGRAYLREGVPNPYGLMEGGLGLVGHGVGPGGNGENMPAVAGAQVDVGQLQEFTIDPVTRVAGALGFHTVCDLKERRVVEAHSYATLFRGYELILKGRDPRDAIDICSRACGVCGGVHSTAASMALEMAFPVVPPPMGVLARNLGETAEFLYDHPLHLFMLAGPDFSELMVKATNPEIWEAAQMAPAPHRDIHGYATIGEIMTALNPLTGRLYLEGLEYTRTAREMCVIMYGKYPHPSTVVPGGLSTDLTFTSYNEYYSRLVQSFDYAKKCVGIWDDIYDFFLTQNPDYARWQAHPSTSLPRTSSFTRAMTISIACSTPGVNPAPQDSSSGSTSMTNTSVGRAPKRVATIRRLSRLMTPVMASAPRVCISVSSGKRPSQW